MSSVLRRIEAPTRYGGLSIKAWAIFGGSALAIVLVIRVLHTPIAPTLAFLSWCVVSPSILLGLWAHQQGVSVPTLIGDVLRWTARRGRRQINHDPKPLLSGGVMLVGEIPTADTTPTWTPEIDEVL